jgi:hypothetical protein
MHYKLFKDLTSIGIAPFPPHLMLSIMEIKKPSYPAKALGYLNKTNCMRSPQTSICYVGSLLHMVYIGILLVSGESAFSSIERSQEAAARVRTTVTGVDSGR